MMMMMMTLIAKQMLINDVISNNCFFSYVVEPYKKYPNLLEVLLNFLKTEGAPRIRREVMYTPTTL